MTMDLDSIANQPLGRSPLDAAQLTQQVAVLGPRWSVAHPDLVLQLRGPMTRTGVVAAQAGSLADALDHHPTITLAYAGLTLQIHTHDVHAITTLDLVYAGRLERWLRDQGW